MMDSQFNNTNRTDEVEVSADSALLEESINRKEVALKRGFFVLLFLGIALLAGLIVEIVEVF